MKSFLLPSKTSRRTTHSASTDSGLAQILFPYGVGVDTHSGFIQCCVIWVAPGPGGTQHVRREEREFATEWPALLAAKAWVLKVLRQIPDAQKHLDEEQLRYCIESTGTYHMPVLLAWRGIPCVVNPLLAGPTRRKTDVLDARLLAHHSITGLWKPSFIASADTQELRVIWAERADAVRRATRCSNQINNIVLRFGHTFGKVAPMRSAMGEGIVADLLDGRVPNLPVVNPAGLPVSVRPRLTNLMTDMHAATQRVKRATIDALAFVSSRDWPLAKGTLPGSQLLAILKSVPGVGDTTALTWLCEVADPRRFQVDKQVAAFCGCDPSLKVSAGKVTSLVRRAGNVRLHQALLYAAAGLLRRPEEPLGNWGKAIAGRHKKGGHRKACGAIARRLACALWHVHRKGEMFTYDGYNLNSTIILPNVPLKTFLKPHAVNLLAKVAIPDTKALGEAYTQGKLATIFGLGAKTIAEIKQWICQHAVSKRFGHRREALAVAAAREKRQLVNARHLQSCGGDTPPQNTPVKDYALDPSRVFKPSSARKRKAQGTPTKPARKCNQKT